MARRARRRIFFILSLWNVLFLLQAAARDTTARAWLLAFVRRSGRGGPWSPPLACRPAGPLLRASVPAVPHLSSTPLALVPAHATTQNSPILHQPHPSLSIPFSHSLLLPLPALLFSLPLPLSIHILTPYHPLPPPSTHLLPHIPSIFFSLFPTLPHLSLLSTLPLSSIPSPPPFHLHPTLLSHFHFWRTSSALPLSLSHPSLSHLSFHPSSLSPLTSTSLTSSIFLLLTFPSHPLSIYPHIYFTSLSSSLSFFSPHHLPSTFISFPPYTSLIYHTFSLSSIFLSSFPSTLSLFHFFLSYPTSLLTFFSLALLFFLPLFPNLFLPFSGPSLCVVQRPTRGLYFFYSLLLQHFPSLYLISIFLYLLFLSLSFSHFVSTSFSILQLSFYTSFSPFHLLYLSTFLFIYT